MKTSIAALIAAAATLASAQSSSSSFPSLIATNTSTEAPVVVTMTIDDCTSTAPPTVITVTNGVTVTYCPACEISKSSAAFASASAAIPHTTIYTTEYISLCTTGSSWYTTPAVYTVTESCTAATASWASGSNYVPPGFTTTVVECSRCAGPSDAPTTLTLTQPCECTHTGFYAGPSPTAPAGSAPAASAPAGLVSQISDGQIQAPTGVVSQISDGQIQAPAGTPAASGGSVSQIPDGQVQAPSPSGAETTTTTTPCPGPECRAGVPAASTSLEAYTGSASTVLVSSWFGVLSSIVAIAVGALAFML